MSAVENTPHDTHPLPDVMVREWRENGTPVRWDLFVTGFRKGTYKTSAGLQSAVQKLKVEEGQRVERVDFEKDGTPAYQGTLTRIEQDGDEFTYWITWDGTDAPDPHGRYAFRVIRAREPKASDLKVGMDMTSTREEGVFTLLTVETAGPWTLVEVRAADGTSRRGNTLTYRPVDWNANS